ncbi:MAG: MFS transporter [Acaryochloridaceae cyanobacterium RU_4_10]|nr:MFS transporter [Acaryochloridaceae cyanobacterium RU_4_10]
MTQSKTSETPKLTFGTKLAYGAGDLGTAITANVLIFYLSPFLTDVAGLSPGLAGRTQLVGKFWDAVNDPMVGVLSDRTKSTRWGRRYPWMLLGAIPFGIFFFLQWVVPNFSNNPETNQWALFIFYTAVSIFFNAFYTVVNVPYTALTPELTQDYNERTSLNSFRFAFSIGGSLLSIIVFDFIIRRMIQDQAQQYLAMAVVCTLLSVLPIYWCVLGTRKRMKYVASQHPEEEEPVSMPIVQQLKVVFSNRPFLFVVGIYLCSWFSLQLTASIVPYFVKDWMRNPEVRGFVLLAVQGIAMLMLPVWSKVSQRYGKKATYFMGMSLWIIAQFGLFFLQPGQTNLMYIFAVMAGCGVSTAYLIPWSMLPDVIELDELNTGQRREGIFYSFMVFLQKICLGVAVAVVLEAIGWAGYIKPTAAVALPEQPEAVLWVIRLAIGPLPTLALIAGLVMAYFYPITREVHAEILLKLAERKLSASS